MYGFRTSKGFAERTRLTDSAAFAAGRHIAAVSRPRLPEIWSSSENVVWCASPVVWNDSIFIHTNANAAGEGAAHKGMSGGRIQYYPSKDEHRSLALCIDFKAGKTRWETELFRGVPKPSRHPKNSYASETPVTDGRRVYFHIGDLAPTAWT
jgi:outer membrane protein assembly factor BamB